MNILVCWEIVGVAVVAVSLCHTYTVVVMITAPSILIWFTLESPSGCVERIRSVLEERLLF